MDFNEEMKYVNAEKSISEKIEEQLNKGDKISKVTNGLEIKPNGSYVLIKPYANNPYEKVEIRESGLIIDDNAGRFKDPNDGEEKDAELGIKVARVIEIGPEVKYVAEGDDIYYSTNSVVPIPFFRQGLYTLAEQRILAVLNTDLSRRMSRTI